MRSDKSDDQTLAESESEAEVLKRIIERADELWSWWRENITENETDREMIAGNQWSEESLIEREGRVTLTINKLTQYVERIMGDILQNPTSIKYRATSFNDQSKMRGKLANQEYDIAEVRSAIAKDIEMKSKAQMWYDRAAQQMCDGGYGWLRADAISDDFGKPIIDVSGVMNPSDAMIDFAGVRPDFSDARDGFVFTRVPIKSFKHLYPGHSAVDFSANNYTGRFPWAREQLIIVAEYWERVRRPEDEIRADLAAGIKRPAYKVVWRRVSGNAILEGGAEGVTTPFSTIPLVPMIGSEVVRADGTRTFQSVHRHARGAQKDSNYWRSEMSGMVAEQGNQPWVGTAAMFEGNEVEWETANTARPSRLIYTVDPESPQTKPDKQSPPDIPAAAMQLYLNATQDLNSSIGMYSASVGTVQGDESGRAILAKERQDSTGKYSFTHGRNAAVRRIGCLIQEAMPFIYADEQEVRIYNDDESIDFVDLPGSEGFVGEYECYVEAGPSYATQRIETVNVLMELAKAAPEKIIGEAADIIAANMDFPAARILQERWKKGIPRQLLSRNEIEELEKDQEGMPQLPPDPNLELQAAIEQAKAAQGEARVAQEQLKVQQEQLQVEQEQIRVQIEQERASNDERVKDLVAQAIAEFLQSTSGTAKPQQLPQQ